MIEVKKIDPDDLALYAMNLLPPDETEEMASNLEHSMQARKMLAEIYGDLAVLALSGEVQAAPAGAKERLAKQVAREKKSVPVPEPVVADMYASRDTPVAIAEEPAPRSAAARALPWAGWAVAAGFLIATFSLWHQRDQLQHTVASSRAQVMAAESRTASAIASADLAQSALNTLQDPRAVQVALTTSGLRPPPQGRATYLASKGSLVFLASNLDPLHGNKTYELWLIPTSGAPIPAGTFQPDQKGFASVVLPALPAGVQAKEFGVTVENAGGSQTPTAPILLHGMAS